MPSLFERIAPWVAITEPHSQQCDAAINRSINNSTKEDRNQPGCLDLTPHRCRTLTLVVGVPFRHLSFVEPARTHWRTTANARCQNSQQRYLPTGPLEMPASLQQLRRPILGLPPLLAMNWRTSPVGYGRWSRT